MGDPAIERLIGFLRVVGRYHLAVNLHGKGPGRHPLDGGASGAHMSPAQPSGNTIPDSVMGLPGTMGMDDMKRELLFGQPGPLFVPIEPITYTHEGMGLLHSGVGRLARPHIVRPFWEALSLMKGRNDLLYDSVRDFAERMRDLMRHGPDIGQALPPLLRMLYEVPQEFLGLPVPDEPASTTYSQNGRRYDKAYEPRLRVIALEQCDRACSHCVALANRHRPRMRYGDFLRWGRRLPLAPLVTITFGEPFFWSERHGRRLLTVSDMATVLAGADPCARLEIITSGINLSSEREMEAAEGLADLPSQIRQRMTIALTVSDFPRYSLEGLEGAEAARKVQKDTFVFAASSGIKTELLSFLDHDSLMQELVIPAASSIFPGFPPSRFVISRNMRRVSKSVKLLGRAAIRGREYQQEPCRGGRTCLSYVGLRIDRELGPFEKPQEFEPRADGSIVQAGDLGLTADGSLIPGCCSFSSIHAGIANMRSDSDAQIKEKTSGFIKRLDALRREGRLDCMECIASANSLRNPRLLLKAHGSRMAGRCISR